MLSSLTQHRAYRILCSILFFLMVIGLPLTSFPLLSRLSGAIVAPFSAIPLALLIVIWLVPFLLQRGKFPAEIIPLIYFVLIAVIITGLGFFLDSYYLKGRDFFDQSLRAFITLAIGLSFYLVFSTYPQTASGLHKTLRFFYFGGAVLIAWTILEVIMLQIHERVAFLPEWMLTIRSLLAVQSRNVLYTNRVTGFAYEPSWFVRQFNLVLFPLSLSAVYQRKSLFKWRLWIFQLEDFFFALALLVFAFSAPRVGLLAFLFSLGYLGILFFAKLHGLITKFFVNRWKIRPNRLTWVKIVLGVLMTITLIVLVGGLVTGYVYFASLWDERYLLIFQGSLFSGDFEFFPLTEAKLIDIGRRLAFAERLFYWFSGWRIFHDYPLGVGLGNAGFYFFDRMSGVAYTSLEMRDLVYRAGYLPNAKNFWVRLLAETGIIGFLLFVVWLYLLWRDAGQLRKSENSAMRILGLAGQLFLMAYIMEGFSMDSFAMPYQWVMLGLMSAGAVIYRRSLRDRPLESP